MAGEGIISKLVDLAVPDSLVNIFDKIGDFIQDLSIFSLNVYVFFLIILFFLLVILLFTIPIKLYPIYKEYESLIKKLLKFSLK
jgi:hypothetical protein